MTSSGPTIYVTGILEGYKGRDSGTKITLEEIITKSFRSENIHKPTDARGWKKPQAKETSRKP